MTYERGVLSIKIYSSWTDKHKTTMECYIAFIMKSYNIVWYRKLRVQERQKSIYIRRGKKGMRPADLLV